MDQDKFDHRKIYAKGYYDGLDAAKNGKAKVVSLRPGDTMRQSLMEAKLRNVSSTEKKIFDAIPIADAWTIKQICSELHRLNITACNLRSVEWCVKNLRDQGLVVEPAPGTYRRVQFREKPVKSEPDMQDSPTPLPSSASFQQKIVDFSSRLRKFADEVDMLALEIDEMLETKDAENKKLLELKQLIKSLGT